MQLPDSPRPEGRTHPALKDGLAPGILGQPVCRVPRAESRAASEATLRQPAICGKPFLAASNALSDHGESSTYTTVRERIEGVLRSLPNSDMLTLTSSHMFISVMA
jgi:hypothetical protein